MHWRNLLDDDGAFNKQIVEEFRANDGKVGGMFEGAPLLLLTTTGARSGQPRIVPLVYTRDDENYVIIASKGGAPTNPDWYHNLIAHPTASIEVGTDTLTVVAHEERGEERVRLYDNQAAKMPNFAEYQQNTDRIIPLFTLRPESQT